MSASADRIWRSPLTMLERWRDRSDGARLRDVLITGYTVDLGFLERFAIATARALGARITILGDAAQALHDPVDVRRAGVAYQHGHAWCVGAFHPKLVVLTGESDIWFAVGSGNPTASGWGHNQELWLTVRSSISEGPQIQADVAQWLTDLPAHVGMASWIAAAVRDMGARAMPSHVDDSMPGLRALGNLYTPLLSQLPQLPTDELRLTAPFFGRDAAATAALVDRFRPTTVRVALQPRWSSFDGPALVAATEGVAEREFRYLPDSPALHGKLIEWTSLDGTTSTLTGSANLTRAALMRTVGEGGNCELSVLAPSATTLLPEGTRQPIATVASAKWRPSTVGVGAHQITLLGAVIRDGTITTELAAPLDVPVTIEVSPTGVPGTWIAVAVVPNGRTQVAFTVPELPGGVVRAFATIDGQRSESTPVFITDPVRCRARIDHETRPALARAPDAADIFLNEQVASRFTSDLARLAAAAAKPATAVPGATSRTEVSATAATDRWADYLDACERALGPSLAQLIFPGRSMSTMPPAADQAHWSIDDIDADVAGDEEESGLDDADADMDDAAGSVPVIAPDARARYRHWAHRWVNAVTTEREPRPEEAEAGVLLPPLPLRMLVTRLYLTLLAAGVWGTSQEWREDLRWLVWSLVPYGSEQDDTPAEAIDHLCALLAVAAATLRQDSQVTGGTERDLLAANAWQEASWLIALANPALTGALLLPAAQAHARVATAAEIADTIALAAAADHDPYAAARADLETSGFDLVRDEGIWIVEGSFSNPVRAAGRAATTLGSANQSKAAVLARNGNRSTLLLWARPCMAIADSRTQTWHVYTLSAAASPQSRTADALGLPAGASISRRQPTPDPVQQVVRTLGIDLSYAESLLRTR